jgi:hypothetical protein
VTPEGGDPLDALICDVISAAIPALPSTLPICRVVL